MRKPQLQVEALIETLNWEVVRGRDFQKVEHVNLQEANAMLDELRDLTILKKGGGCRKLCAVDSRVCVGAWAKGRSGSWRFNAVLRRALS